MSSPHKYIRLKSGIKFYFLRPTINMINLEDIVWSLSHINRFLGHTDEPVSVLQHVCHVHDLAPDDCKAEALYHDSAEALLGDVVSKLKTLLPEYRDLEMRVEKLIARKFKLRYPWPSAVKRADLIALADEMVSFTPRQDWRDLPFPPSGVKLVAWSPKRARREFMKRFNKLKKTS
jgi:hypothetical protein